MLGGDRVFVMHDPVTTLSLITLTSMSLGACVLAMMNLGRSGEHPGVRRWRYSLLGLCTLGATILFLYRAWWVHRGWQPLQSHVDGLLLIACLFAVLVLFLQSRAGMLGLTTFALPVLTLLLAWAVCASAWTFELFRIDSVWISVHLACVYLGTLFFSVAAIGGGMFLYAQRRIRRKEGLQRGNPLASLEAIETLMVRCSTLGFGLLTLGLVMGLMIHVSTGKGWRFAGGWYLAKVTLALVVWGIYALAMNVRQTTNFRGARAAWLCIAGLVLLLITYGIVVALPADIRVSVGAGVRDIVQRPPIGARTYSWGVC